MKDTILVVDDQEDERNAMAHLLHRHGYLVEHARDGREALDRLRHPGSLTALVVLDLNMPEMDGWEFLGHAAQDPALCHLPVVVVSGSPAANACASSPNVAFLPKPVQPRLVVKLIAEMLRDFAQARAPPASTGAASGTRTV